MAIGAFHGKNKLQNLLIGLAPNTALIYSVHPIEQHLRNYTIFLLNEY
jgi:hypothetical protein